jgi:hypothetical protein
MAGCAAAQHGHDELQKGILNIGLVAPNGQDSAPTKKGDAIERTNR